VAIIYKQMLKTKEKKIFDITHNSKLQITINCKFSLIYNSFGQHQDIVQSRDIVVQVIFRHHYQQKNMTDKNE